MKMRFLTVALLLAQIGVIASARREVPAAGNSSPEAAIRAVLEAQTDAWNRGDIESFMAGYWKSDRTTFLGASGMFRGWQAVLDRYRRRYPDRQAMGHLTFSNLEIHLLAPAAAFVTGEFHLQREKDHPEGAFTLILRRFPEGWRIVHDHTTAFPPQANDPNQPR